MASVRLSTPQDPNDLAATFSDVERQFYEIRYTTFIEGQNERNAKIRHTERNRSIPDLLSSRKTCPEETIYQLGTLDEHASAEDLLNIVTKFIEEFKAKFGNHVHVLDWALHLDESTPHIHERHVFTVGKVETSVIVLGVIGAVGPGSSVVSC